MTACGHSFCQDCLIKQFEVQLDQYREGVDPHYDPRTAAPFISDNVVARQSERVQVSLVKANSAARLTYACPKCRAAVPDRPCESYTIKGIAQFCGQKLGEKDPDEVADAKGKGKGKAAATPHTVWEDFFGLT